ncbi:glycyl-radical enzyme activating protein [Bacillus canaveralius]|uniref:Glycyl-radical enzyme activating protein n=1 Tax=Bacillus canaveralius TaxID=1403243 RepID=A0A2N5GSH2_9BACI|nr:glycyl-radical enzyme activating protein [Bacillus canaveralius]PLR86722.1 glycyl-radical enzyme activating protein [Bacillus canaveralius]PLR92816.1 glycyl-radical enzyme activating protein [Bacillus canaveralius]
MSISKCDQEKVAQIFNIQRWSLHDGPGIRTVVFLKGCPLRCLWCCNPESQESYSEMAYFKDQCIGSGRCIKSCPHGAITLSGDSYITDYSKCIEHCYNREEPPYKCTVNCWSQARKTIGNSMSVSKVLNEVLKDSLMYKQSGGGVTVSGGEPMSQFSFVKELLQQCKENWLHTAMETCGFSRWENYEEIMEYVDLLFLDLKHFDDDRHKELTGQSNVPIFENARRLASFMRSKGGEMVVRIPIIPGYNDSEENVKSIVGFVSSQLEGVKVIELMPYHRLGRGKYPDIGKSYQLNDVEVPSQTKIDSLHEIILQHGLAVQY